MASAILLALSPALTVTCWPPGVGAAAALAGAAATGTLAVALPADLSDAAGGRAVATRAGASGLAGAGVVTGTGAEAEGKSWPTTWGAVTPGEACRVGGSSNMV